MSARRFHLGDVLSITTGILVSPRKIDGVYEILNFMTGDSLFTHQLPRVSNECRPHLLRQHPQLADVSVEAMKPEDVMPWLQRQVVRFGRFLSVAPIPKDDHARRDPLTELINMIGPDKVIIVNPDDPAKGEGN